MSFRQSLLLATLTLTAAGLLFLPGSAVAAKYPAGSLIKRTDKPDIYYYASDEKLYKFPDMATLLTWYDRLENIIQLDLWYFKGLKKADVNITVFPTSRLVKFDDSPRVYAVRPGAVLRWVRSEAVATALAGKEWNRFLTVLPAKNISDYRIGEDIVSVNQVETRRELKNVLAMERELKARGYMKTTAKEKKTSSDSGVYTPNLKALSTDAGKLSPKFSSTTQLYTIEAEATKRTITIKAEPQNPHAQVYINNNLLTNPAAGLTFNLIGENEIFEVKVLQGVDTERVYKIIVKRKNVKDSPYLRNLFENLSDNLSPQFHPLTRNYTITAEPEEQILAVTPLVESSNSTVSVNSIRVPINTIHEVALMPGKNVVTVEVQSKKGILTQYRITVTRKSSSSQNITPKVAKDGPKLKVLSTNLGAEISPAINDETTTYTVTAPSDKMTAEVSVVSQSGLDRVYINGVKTQKDRVTLGVGTNTVLIELIDQFGKRSIYKLIIKK